jgi:hypothetical protein
MGFGWSLGFAPYNEWWKNSRRLFHKHFQPSTLPQFRPKQTKAAHGFLQKLLDSPERFHENMQLYVLVLVSVREMRLTVFDGQDGW